MSWQKRFINLVFSFGLGAGVLFAQICNVVCLAANCADGQASVRTETPQPTSHCHQSDAPAPQDPTPQPDSHNCQTHDLTILLNAVDAKTVVVAPVDWQAVAILPIQPEIVYSTQSMERVRLSALRSPPRLPQRLILRI